MTDVTLALNARTVVSSGVDKRQAILDAAERVFLRAGYGAASMDAIARAAGVAKQTVYAHFGTKAALFAATMREKCDWLLEPLPEAAVAGDDPATALDRIARRLLEIILSSDGAARLRVVLAERSRFPEIAEIFYRTGPGRATAALADYLSRLHRRRVLHVPDAQLSAQLFLGMVRGDLFLRHLLGLQPPPTKDEVDLAVRSAVCQFLAAHAVSETPSNVAPRPRLCD